MNKSEIAELVAREIAKLATGWDYSDVPDLFEEEILKHVERAIAESQAPQPCSSNSITLAENSDEPEPEECPTCNGYHLGGCHRKAELGDGEPSPPPVRCSFCHKEPNQVEYIISSPNDYPRVYICTECVEVCQSILIERSGAAQEVSPVGYVSEIRPRPDDPSCHVCGAQMVVKEWACLSCKATTGVEEVSPPSPDAFQEAWVKYNKVGNATGWERVGFVGGFKLGFDAGRKSAEGDTRELKAALQAIEHALHDDHGDFWKAREFLDKRGRFNDNLEGNAILLEVAQLALLGWDEGL